MKKILLSALLLSAAFASAQTVNSFYSISSTPTNYYLVTSDPALDETPSGVDANWEFVDLTSYGDSQTSVLAATAEQSAAYPGTTSVVETTGDFTTTQFFLANATNGQVSVTAASAAGILLNYSTNNLNLGTFPKSFQDNATEDTVAGTFTYGGVPGSFTGTATTAVDAYGSLIGFSTAGMPMVVMVTRLKIEQDLTLSAGPVPLGTLNQVMYSYYADGEPVNGPAFRTITGVVSIPALGINQTEQSIESFYNPSAGLEDFNALKMAVVPNPVNNVLHFSGNDAITAVTITDAAGRNILTAKGNDINVAHLNSGVYFVSAQTTAGTLTQKIVKQ